MLVYIGVLLFVCSAQASFIRNADSKYHVPGEYLVVLNSPTAMQDRKTYVSNFINKLSGGTEVLQRFDTFKSPILHVQTSDEDALKLLRMPEVRVVDANLRQKMIQQCASQSTGEDLWGLSRISSRAMPDYDTAMYNYDQSGGEGTRVYVLDTGIRVTHNDFGGRAVYGTNIVDPGSDPSDGNGHGTHCAGIVAGMQFGVSKGNTIVAVKTLTDQGFGSISQIIEGISWAMGDVEQRGIRGVLSMSLGGSSNAALDAAVEGAIAAGLPVVAAAGNSNTNACNFSPGGAEGVITVAGTGIQDAVSSGSNWGPCVDIMAPSQLIRSASHLSDTDSRVLSGSSMATAFVVGQVANYLTLNPVATPAEVTAYLQRTATQDAIDLLGKELLNLLLYASCE